MSATEYHGDLWVVVATAVPIVAFTWTAYLNDLANEDGGFSFNRRSAYRYSLIALFYVVTQVADEVLALSSLARERDQLSPFVGVYLLLFGFAGIASVFCVELFRAAAEHDEGDPADKDGPTARTGRKRRTGRHRR